MAGAYYTLDRFSATARGTLFGKTSQQVSGDGTNFYNQRIGTAVIADLELNYRLTDQFELSIGANNIFNKKPPTIQLLADGSPADGGLVYDAPLGFSPYGINGGYYYARINFNF
ncbi:MAG: TonB-dependent receptor [Sphingomonas fennica]